MTRTDGWGSTPNALRNRRERKITIPDSVWKRLGEMAESRGLSRSRMVEELIMATKADEMRARNRGASTNHHQWLQDSARGLLSDDIRLITVIASQCGSKREFWRRMRHHYCREPLQLGLGA